MSNVGSLESVVSSELAYSTPSADLSEDLFTVRWALGELLYYTRDDNVAVRRRTTISIFFRADLAEARRKDQGAPYQRTTLALASIVVWIGRALHLLRGEAAHFRLSFDGALDVERSVIQLALIREIAAKVVSVEESSEAEVAIFEAEQRKSSRLVSVRVGGRAGEAEADSSVYVAATAPPAVDRRSGASLGIEGWAEVTSALLATL
ncbi:MAG: hypothetical protein HOV80_38875 [Polyangiaceae bacterium]|nr:hypothetical protein [Polyangiaceae bacterium]